MEEYGKTIKVSVIVPVYNSEKYLRTCLDSLLFQNFEDFEIVVVNNGSTDNSGRILEEYADKYPDKIFVHTIEHSDFVGTGRNFGLSKARGECIYLCDSDDIVEKNALFFMYGRMKRFDLDVVYGTVEFVNLQSNTRFLLQSDGEREVSIEELILSGAEFWRRMFRKSLLDRVGPMPENTCFDDIAWIPVVHSYARKAMSTERKIYNYFRRTSSTVGGTSERVIKETIISEKYAVEHCNPLYKNQILLFVAKRILSNIKTRWEYKDILVDEIGYFWEQFKSCSCITQDAHLFAELELYYKISLNLIPKTIYISDTDKTEIEKIDERVKSQAFLNNDCKVILYDKLNKRKYPTVYSKFINAAKQAGDYALLHAFYGLFDIYQNGGIYMSAHIKINTVLNYLRCNGSFFTFVDENTYSDWIFGGAKGNEVIGKILETFGGDGYYKNILYPMNARIKNILTVLYEIPLNGTSSYCDDKVTVYSPEVLVFNPYKSGGGATTVQICEHDFSQELSEGYVVVKETTLSWCEKRGGSNRGAVNLGQAALDNTLLSDYQNMKQRLEAIETSDAMRLTLWLYGMGNKLKFPKRIVKKLLHRTSK